MPKLLPVIIIALTLLHGFACSPTKEKRVAEVDGEFITLREVEKAAGKTIAQLEEQLYDLKRQKLDELIDEKLINREAAARGVSIADLLSREVISKVLPVTDEEVGAMYKANRDRISVDLDRAREHIREYLAKQREGAQRSIFLQSLRAKAKIETYLSPPPVYRIDIPIEGAPYKGPADAAVTMVKFEDFHCPFCRDIQPVIQQLLVKFDGKLKVVHRDFPIDGLHPQAHMAAEAGRCADEQGKFWDFHDKLYANAPRADRDQLKADAESAGLDVDSFWRCVESGKYRPAVQNDVEAGGRLGVNGTPTFFINGREIYGGQSLQNFSRIIEKELADATGAGGKRVNQ